MLMFTGLVQNLGTIVALKPIKEGLKFAIRTQLPARVFKKGASIAVDGVCLTVERYSTSQKTFETTAVFETLKKTTLQRLHKGARVHLEAALTLQTALGGHLMSGHVDATGEVLTPAPRLTVKVPSALARYLAPKGSVAVDGVSLTIVKSFKDRFEVALIPETLASTHLGGLTVGDCVNIEVDLISRYLEHLTHFSK